MGEKRTAPAGGDRPSYLTHSERMGTTIDFIRQSAPVEWLLTPAVLVAAAVLLVVILSGVPGRIYLEVESRSELRQMRN